MSSKYNISVVIPVYNEQESLKPLVGRLLPVLNSMGTYEIIFVDDGSSDGSESVLTALVKEFPNIIKVIRLRTNFGKSIALQHGFDSASGEFVAMMDADLQDNPEGIPELIKHLKNKNLDVVTGWRFTRRDRISKTLLSRFFNFTVSRFSNIDIHDFNCGLKVMRKECVKNLRLYGKLHRFMVVLLAGQGFKVGELKVEHSPRRYGRSKYGGSRIYEGIMDLLTIIFITRYMQSPLYFFGFYGLCCMIFSVLYGGYFLVFHFISLLINFPQGRLSEHPLWLLAPVIFLAGMIFIFFGLLGELIYSLFSGQIKHNYIQEGIGSIDYTGRDESVSKQAPEIQR